MRTLLIFSLFFGIAPFISATQTPVSLPKIIVQASSLPDPTPLDSADVTCITAKDIEQQQFVTLAGALRRVPGVYVSQNGGIGQEARVSLRGGGDSRTAIILDGMPLNDAGSFDGSFDLSRITLDDIYKVQVVRGPMSSLYGSNGIGGVLTIETKKGEGAHKTFAKGEGGSYGTYSQLLGMQGQKGLIDYRIMGSRLQSAGTPVIPDSLRAQVPGNPDNPLHQENFSARLGFGTESHHIAMFNRYLTRRLAYRLEALDPEPMRRNLSESFHRMQGHFESFEGRWTHEMGIGYYQSDLKNTYRTAMYVEEKGTQLQGDWRQIFEATNHLQFQLVTDFSQEKLNRHISNNPYDQWQTTHGGVGGALVLKPWESLTLTGSTRLDKYQAAPVKPTYRIGANYYLGTLILKGGIGTAFKAPSLKQRFSKGLFSGNPNLKPEQSLGWDFGIEHPLFQRRLTLSATIFQNHIKDFITGSNNTLINIDKTRTQGMEGIINFRFTQDWNVELAHTYTQTRNKKTKRVLLLEPLNKTTLRVIGQLGSQWQVSGNILYIGRTQSDDSLKKASSYAIVGTETSYQLNEQYQIYGRVENLFDRRYKNFAGFQQPGFGVYAGVRAQW